MFQRVFRSSVEASTRVRGFYPPGYREALRRRATLPDVTIIAAALNASGGRFLCSPRALRRTFDRFFEGLHPPRRRTLERLLRWTGLTPIPRATDNAVADLFHCGLPPGMDEIGIQTDADYLPEMLAHALDAGYPAVRPDPRRNDRSTIGHP